MNSQSTSFIPQRPTQGKLKNRGVRKIYILTYVSYVLFFGTLIAAAGVDSLSQIREITTLLGVQDDVIIMGDFNESPLTEVKKDLMDAFGLKDPWIEKNYPEETSHHGFSGTSAVTGDRIDWILMPKSFECTKLVMDKRSFQNVYPSDHYPLVATVIPK